jgi:hypothetical protein
MGRSPLTSPTPLQQVILHQVCHNHAYERTCTYLGTQIGHQRHQHDNSNKQIYIS